MHIINVGTTFQTYDRKYQRYVESIINIESIINMAGKYYKNIGSIIRMAESIIKISKFYEYERMYCKNIESIINIAGSIFVCFGA